MNPASKRLDAYQEISALIRAERMQSDLAGKKFGNADSVFDEIRYTMFAEHATLRFCLIRVAAIAVKGIEELT